ncbi:aldo/keto reductase [Bacillaceae bacterium IKA-2]|nr:aldo/keto reductase [Bacillaceae bacterium IKA-2]
MKKRQIGTSNLFVSPIGLGCMSLKPTSRESEYILDKAIDVGVNYFDTADLYDFGKNEELLGRVLATKRTDIIIATKVGNEWNTSKDSWSWNPTKHYIKAAVKKSLKRLQTDYLDLCQLHGGTIDDPIDETIEAFEELTKEGLIRYYGISSIRPNVIKTYVEKSNIVNVMIQYSLLDRRPEKEISPLLDSQDISIITRGPLAKGLLTENLLQKLVKNDYLSYSNDDLQELLPRLKQWANDHHYQFHELALLYCLANKTVAAVVPGASSVKQLQENLAVLQKPMLTEQQLSELHSLTKCHNYTDHL